MVSTSTIINIFNPPFPQSAQTSNNSAIKSFKKKAANIVINGIQHIKHKKFPINKSGMLSSELTKTNGLAKNRHPFAAYFWRIFEIQNIRDNH